MRLAVDPGLLSPGVALMNDDRMIVATQRFTPEISNVEPIGQRCMNIAKQIVRWTFDHATVSHLIFEWPQQYDSRVGKTKGNPNNLTPLAGVGMAIAGLLNCSAGLITPTPSDWIGQIPKACPVCGRVPGKKSCKACKGSAWETPRGRLIRENLFANELVVIPDQNDVIDACGIALWSVKRLRSKIPGLVTG